jgi:hypothetical protein
MPDTTIKPYDQKEFSAFDNEALPFIKPEDVSYFSALLQEVNESELS